MISRLHVPDLQIFRSSDLQILRFRTLAIFGFLRILEMAEHVWRWPGASREFRVIRVARLLGLLGLFSFSLAD
jgi:hypothetical protein